MDNSNSLISQIQDLLPHSGIDSERKRKLLGMLNILSPLKLQQVLVVLKKEREVLMKVLRKAETLDLQVELLRKKLL